MPLFSKQDATGSWQLSLSIDGSDHDLGPHFRLAEMACKDGSDMVLVHPHLIALLEALRAHFNAPVKINSGYRTDAHNRSVGGSPGSKHKLGCAADIVIAGVSPEEVAVYADNELKTGGVGRYSSFTHVDVCGLNRRWSG